MTYFTSSGGNSWINFSSLISPLIPYLDNASLAIFLIAYSFRFLSWKRTENVIKRSLWVILKSLSESYNLNRNLHFYSSYVSMWNGVKRCKKIYNDIFLLLIFCNSYSNNCNILCFSGFWFRKDREERTDSSMDFEFCLSSWRNSF